MVIKVKICGITNKEDVRMAINLGADAIGVIVNVPEKTPRKIDMEKAREIFKNIPPFVSSVVVLIPDSIEKVEIVARELNPDIIQLHGQESLEFVAKLKERVRQRIIKTVQVGEDPEVVGKAKKFSTIVDGILLDTKINNKSGGTGKIHDWEISAKIKEAIKPKPLILSGGLNPENVGMAIKKVKPYAVDVSSGIELRPGKKDKEKVEEFVRKAKGE